MIRKATQNDIPQLVEWMKRLVAHVQTSSGDPYVVNVEDGYENNFADWFTELIQSDAAVIFVAVEDEGNAGFIAGTLTAPFLTASTIKRIGQIDLCWVEPAKRRKGIARKLCLQVERWFNERGIKYVDIQYLVGNSEAEKSWFNLGYKPYRIFSRKELRTDEITPVVH